LFTLPDIGFPRCWIIALARSVRRRHLPVLNRPHSNRNRAFAASRLCGPAARRRTADAKRLSPPELLSFQHNKLRKIVSIFSIYFVLIVYLIVAFPLTGH
jgi:hypothetical protein